MTTLQNICPIAVEGENLHKAIDGGICNFSSVNRDGRGFGMDRAGLGRRRMEMGARKREFTLRHLPVYAGTRVWAEKSNPTSRCWSAASAQTALRTV